jgi:hypothetical protein
MRARLGLVESDVAVPRWGASSPKGFDVLVEAMATADVPSLRLLVVDG